MRKIFLLSLILLLMFAVVGCSELPEEIDDVSVNVTRGFRTDSRGRVQYTVTIRNNSDKTLESGSFKIYSVDISGRQLSYDGIYPENIRPNGSRTATVWLEMPSTASVQGEWLSARFE
jgi:hypothetical protein